MPLRVIVIQTSVKGHLEPLLAACGQTFNFEPPTWLRWESLSNPKELPDQVKGPAFWILEVPAEDSLRVKFDELLEELDERPHSWVYVLSPQEQFNSDEAARMWMRYRCVVNYGLIRHLNPADLKRLLGELLERSSIEPQGESHPVGWRLEMPPKEYERRKFVSLFLGGMRPVLWEVKRFLRALEESSSLVQGAWLKHPFLQPRRSGNPKLRNPQELFDEIVGRPDREKPAEGIPKWMRELQEKAKEEGFTLPHLLILGETGTGKTLLARFLHRHRFEHFGGQQRDLSALSKDEQRLIELILQELNCGAIPENLIEGELFGAKAGAWTDLSENLPGKIFCSCLGTLFLDEIGSLPLRAQATLLKYLDDYSYKPVGWDGEPFYIPAVVIASTNQPLERLVEDGKFRQDLYERFRFRVQLPSLKERMDHFDELVDFILQNPRINPVIGGAKRRVNYISKEALQRLKQHDWPGNFRELEQVLWRAVDAAYAEGLDLLLPRHLPLQGRP
jgi:DNA polymerase III delta prime subunit